MVIEERSKLEQKNQKLIVVIICCIGVFIFPFVSDSQISVPGFSYTPSVGGQIVDNNGKPSPGAYILYDYHGYTPGTLGGSSPDYIKNPTIIVTDTNGQFAIPSLSFKKPLWYGRPELAILTGYSPTTHCAFVVNSSGNHQKIILQDNTNDPKAWGKDLNAFESGYGQLMSDVGVSEWGNNFVVKNGKEVEAMVKKERRLLNGRNGKDDVTLNNLKNAFEWEVLRDMLPLATHLKINEKIYAGDLDGAIAVYTTLLEQKPDFFYAYVGRGELKKKKGDLDGALADYNTVIKVQPKYILARLGRGELKQGMGDYDGALADYNAAINFRPKNASAYECRGFVKHAQGDSIGAQEDFNKAIELDPEILAPILMNVNSMSTTNSK